MSTSGKTKDPLGPIEFIVTLVLTLLCAVLLSGLIASIVSAVNGSHTHV